MNKRQWKKKYDKQRHERYKKVLEVGEVIYSDKELCEQFIDAVTKVLARQIHKSIIH